MYRRKYLHWPKKNTEAVKESAKPERKSACSSTNCDEWWIEAVLFLTPAPLLSALVFRLVSGEEEKKLGC